VIATRLVRHATATHIANIHRRVCHTSLSTSQQLEVDFPVLTHRGISLALATYENFAKRQPTQLEVQQVAGREAEGKTEREEESQIGATQQRLRAHFETPWMSGQSCQDTHN
jgi:hypothetical protein